MITPNTSPLSWVGEEAFGAVVCSGGVFGEGWGWGAGVLNRWNKERMFSMVWLPSKWLTMFNAIIVGWRSELRGNPFLNGRLAPIL